MSNTLANHQYDEILARTPPESITVTLDRDEAEALYTVLGILEVGVLDELHTVLHAFCEGESSYLINEPDDGLRLTQVNGEVA